ncbi:MAG: DNA cytosine methyltransferase, partial [Leucobacter sp.]|nr:DNA cytosine methyltransferase [Leucobacter sp.]
MTVAVDHFAGLGWGVACERLGIREYGVELAPSVVRMRSANGMRTIYRDVWTGLFHPWMVPSHRLYIASPPCQTFSAAGNGEGRRALDDVLAAIEERRHEDPARLHELTGMMDPRTALVLTPLAHIFQHRPELVALEQVPEVLPVWHTYATVLRQLGYSVWVGIMRAEQFGVPQTRKRAILIARLDGKVEPPTATHSRYYSTDPGRLDPGVAPWVS